MLQSPLKIVVIDDNEAMADLLADLLDNMPNYKLAGIAYDGKQGIDLINETQPDVAILDLCMPYIDGLGVMEAFQNKKGSDVPLFIISTCVGQEHITSKAMKLGASYYMIKPFDFDHFENRLNELAQDVYVKKIKNEELPSESQNLLGEQVMTKSYENRISELMHSIGVPAHTKGYVYLKDAIGLVLEDVKYMMKITKNLYPTIAERHDTTASRVERAIRNAIELTLVNGNKDVIANIFDYRVQNPKAKLTNSEFIAIIAEKIKVEN